jgi:catechol 2,3-dioxygenase-like lactoylglutathione lyase family enzyme
MRLVFDHVDLRVRSLEEARRFYGAVLGALGMVEFATDEARSEQRWLAFGYPEQAIPIVALFFAAEVPPSLTRIAFAAESQEEVDRAYEAAASMGALALEPPALCPEYFPDYYAAFFSDPDGNRLEVAYGPSRRRAPSAQRT